MKQRVIVDYVLVWMLIASSGIVGFYDIQRSLVVITLFTFVVWKSRRSNFPVGIYKCMVLVLGFIVIQWLYFGVFNLQTNLGFFCRFAIAIFVTQSMTLNSFVRVFVNTIGGISLLAILAHLPILLDPSFNNIYQKLAFSYSPSGQDRQLFSMVVYNPSFVDSRFFIPRNSGPFWEPGAFSVFLIIGFWLNRVYQKSFKNWNSILMLTALITSFSTSGIVSIFVTIIYFSVRWGLQSKFILVGVLGLFIFVFTNFVFVGEKIEGQFAKTEEQVRRGYGFNRFSSLKADLEDFVKDPIIGRGLSSETRFKGYLERQNRNNGISDLLVRLGIFGFIYYLLMLSRSVYRIKKLNGVSRKLGNTLFLSCIIVGFSETIFLYPFSMSLCLLQYAPKKREIYRPSS